MKMVYIAGPYTKPDPIANTRNAIEIAEVLWAAKMLPYIPHLCMLWEMMSPQEFEYWMDLGREYILKCDALLRIPGISIGADREVLIAEEHDIPVFFTLGELLYGRLDETEPT